MPSFIGIWELIALGAVLLLLFGPKRLPELGRSLGRGMREFKEGVTTPLETHEHVDPRTETAPGAPRRSMRTTAAAAEPLPLAHDATDDVDWSEDAGAA